MVTNMPWSPTTQYLGPGFIELSICIESNSFQYADDTNIWKSSSKANTILTIRTLENDSSEFLKLSKNNALVFNNDKLKSIAFSSRKSNDDKSFLIRSKGKSIQQEPTAKLLGVTFDQHLTLDEQTNIIINSNYNILRIYKTFKWFIPWNARKILAESLIISRINYCIVVHSQIPKLIHIRSQPLQNFAAEYVLGKYANALDLINLNQLPVTENTEFNVSKLAYQGLHDKTDLNIYQLNWLNGEEIFDRTIWDQWLTMVERIHSSNSLSKFLTRYQLILEYVKKKTFINKARGFFKKARRITPWLEYCHYKVFSIFLFILSIWDFCFNFSILVSVVEYVRIFMFLFSIFDLPPTYLIC